MIDRNVDNIKRAISILEDKRDLLERRMNMVIKNDYYARDPHRRNLLIRQFQNKISKIVQEMVNLDDLIHDRELEIYKVAG